MAIYTSYFANIKNLPNDTITIAICGKVPEWYSGAQYKKLAPKWSFFKVWKETKDNDYYIEHFQKEVLDKLDPAKIILELTKMAQNRTYAGIHTHNIALICYEKPSDFCHRHLVANWINKWYKKCGLEDAEVKEWSKDGINS